MFKEKLKFSSKSKILKYRESFLSQFLFQYLLYFDMQDKKIVNKEFYKKYKKFLFKYIPINAYTKKYHPSRIVEIYFSFIEKKYIFLNY